MANLAAVTSLAGPGDAVVVDRLCHASILDAVRLSRARLVTFRHNDAASLAEKLSTGRACRRRLVVTESLFSMDGDVAPLAELARVAREHGAMFVVDEAHATGVFGRSGAGLVEEQGVARDDVTATVGTLSKSLGGLGGFISGRREVIDLVVNRARPLMFSTGISPIQAATALAALQIVRDEPRRRMRLLQQASHLRRRLCEMGMDIGGSASQIVPVIVGDAGRALAVSRALWECGVFVPAIRPPSVPRATSRLRISLQHGHTAEHIERLTAALGEAVASGR
jgi:7-keto-8-aminopelargonate synthetase-like enzyme